MVKSPTQTLGDQAEAQALQFLQDRGLVLVTRNFRTRFGEIDLIMQDAQCLVFIEVRLRNHKKFGTGAESITQAKQRRLIRTAQIYLSRRSVEQNKLPTRFDVVSISKSKCVRTFDWIHDAFN